MAKQTYTNVIYVIMSQLRMVFQVDIWRDFNGIWHMWYTWSRWYDCGTKVPVIREHLLEHIRYKHSKVNVYKCDLCGYAAAQKGILSVHMNGFHCKIK